MAGKKEKKTSPALIIIISLLLAGVVLLHLSGVFTIGDMAELFGGIMGSETENTAEVHFINVGQGDCELIVCGGESMLIDTGEKENAEKVCEYIRSLGLDGVDYMLLTHPHSDHMGGASKVIDSINVGKIIIPKIPEDMAPTTKFYEKFLESVSKKGLKLTPAKPHDTYNIGDSTLEIISPVKDYEDFNNFSAAAILTHGGDSFMFAGDIEKTAEKDILEEGSVKDIDVLKVAHHGSSTSSSKNFLEAALPDYAVICCESGNSYNHPHKKTVERLLKYTDKIYRTDLNGTIVFTSYGDKLEVVCEKEE